MLTPKGWVNIEDIRVGDSVVTPKNTIETVMGVYPQGVVDIYRVTFQDGRTVDCCGEHLWQYHIAGRGKVQSTVSNTLELKEIVDKENSKEKGERKWRPILPFTSPVTVSHKPHTLPIDPYVLGVILGDGHVPSAGTPRITSMDDEVFEEIEKAGYTLGTFQQKENNKAYSYSILGVNTVMRDLGLNGKLSYDKFIPDVYKTASVEDRYSVLQGLFDTDGYVDEGGNVYFDITSKRMSDDVREILHSLGYSATQTTKVGTYRKDGEKHICATVYKLYVRGLNQRKLFRLSRKADRCVDKQVGLRIDSIELVGKDEATCIAITGEDKLFLTTNYVVTHNTILALFKILPWINDPDFKAVFVRQSSTQLRQGGGLWEEAKSVFRHYGAYFKEQQLQAVFSSGATVYFKVMGRDADIYNFDGGQYTMIFVDEAQHHTQLQVMYLASRLRSKSKAPHQLICTCNPLKTSFLMKFVQYSLDDEGIPIRSLAPKQRYYAEYAGDLVFADTAEEMLEKYPSVIPMTYAFHPATVEDNPIIKKRNPDYINRLKNMNRVDKLRLYYGSWYASADADKYWKRDWVGDVIDYIPPDVQIVSRVRAWDLAASPEPTASSVNRDPDWTAGVLISRDRMGTYYVEDVVRFRRTSNEVLQAVINQAFVDGDGVQVVIPRDAGAGGVGFHAFMIRSLAEHGIAARTAKVSGHSGKLQRFLPFASMCENGQVKILRGDWNDHYFDELENFIGGGREQKSHDDMVDASSDAFNTIARSSILGNFAVPDLSRVSSMPF